MWWDSPPCSESKDRNDADATRRGDDDAWSSTRRVLRGSDTPSPAAWDKPGSIPSGGREGKEEREREEKRDRKERKEKRKREERKGDGKTEKTGEGGERREADGPVSMWARERPEASGRPGINMDPRWNRGETRVGAAETVNSAGCELSLMNFDSRGLPAMGSGSRGMCQVGDVGGNESDAGVETPTCDTFSYAAHSRQVCIYLVEALYLDV
jgi:hypothetical protein